MGDKLFIRIGYLYEKYRALVRGPVPLKCGDGGDVSSSNGPACRIRYMLPGGAYMQCDVSFRFMFAAMLHPDLSSFALCCVKQSVSNTFLVSIPVPWPATFTLFVHVMVFFCEPSMCSWGGVIVPINVNRSYSEKLLSPLSSVSS